MAIAAIVGRVVFRVVFNVDDGKPVAFELPRLVVNLGIGPETKLFGPVSWNALAVSFADGVRLAAVLIGVSLLFTLIDVKQLLARVPSALQPIAMPVGSALTFIPTLAANIARITSAVKLLPGKRGSIITPVMEGTVERALALAQSMEVRGFGLRDPRINSPVKLEGFGLAVADRVIFEKVDFVATPGTITLLTGATGSGKTLFLKSLCGLAPNYTGGRTFGLLSGGPAVYVNQQPELSFVAETVSAEIGFALIQRGWSRADVKVEVDRLANLLSLGPLLERRVSELSAGQQQRVAIAAALATGYRTLLLDEPSSALDPNGVRELASALSQATSSGIAVVIAEHHVDRFAEICDQFFILNSGALARSSREQMRSMADRKLRTVTSKNAIEVVTGPNGCGKSTRLRAIAASETAAVLVPQVASDLLLSTTVANEIEDELSKSIFRDLVGEVDYSLHPHDLSSGMQLALAIAIQLSRRASLILLDEPTRGFDHEAKNQLLELVEKLSLRGHRFVIATNDVDFLEALSGTVTDLSEGAVLK